MDKLTTIYICLIIIMATYQIVKLQMSAIGEKII
jgi:hypothetical protein